MVTFSTSAVARGAGLANVYRQPVACAAIDQSNRGELFHSPSAAGGGEASSTFRACSDYFFSAFTLEQKNDIIFET